MTRLHIAVVGGGIVGACCALELIRRGHQVTLIEPATPGGEHSASHGNGGWISPASVVPMSLPGQWKKIPGYLLDPMGPLTLRWRALPRLLPWLWRFVRAGRTIERVRATSRALGLLLRDAPALHETLARHAGVEHLIHRQGLLYAYPDEASYRNDALAWQLRRENGVEWDVLEGPALQAKAPALGPQYHLGAFVTAGAWCSDPGLYVARLVEAGVALGIVRIASSVTGLSIRDGRCEGVVLPEGPLSCDRVLVAAGLGSPALARQAGDALPMASERGYHMVLPNAGLELPQPVMPSDGRMANTLMQAGLRLAGQVELAAVDAPPDWARADILMGHARRAYPALADESRLQAATRWMGHRPSTPDGLPVIGPSARCEGVWYATGHGHIGLAASARSAEIVADLMDGACEPQQLAAWQAFRIDRF